MDERDMGINFTDAAIQDEEQIYGITLNSIAMIAAGLITICTVRQNKPTFGTLKFH